MRLSKLGAVVASLAVTAGTTAVLAAGPADAATATTTKLTMSNHLKVKGAYGDYLGSLEGSVSDANGSVYDGTVQLQAKLPGKSWKTVKTTTASGFVYFGSYGSKAKGNVQYRAHYLGSGSDAASYSKVVTVTTVWAVKDKSSCSGGCHIRGTLKPKAKHHKVLIQVKKKGHWKRYKVTHTNAKSKFSVKVSASRKGTHYRLVIKGNKNISTRKITYTATRY
jgi:hypothetical protein